MDWLNLINLPGLTGWPATVVTLAAIAVYGLYIRRSAKSKAEELAKKAYEDAIKAMQTHTAILQERIKEAEDENHRLQERIKEAEDENRRVKNLMETLYEALEQHGVYVTVSGRMVHINISTTEKEKDPTIHIKDEQKSFFTEKKHDSKSSDRGVPPLDADK